MHLLAISGLHVAILAGLVFAGCRLAGVSTTAMVVIVLGTLWSYALITDLRPPVLRSALLGCLVVAAIPSVRLTSGFNLLSGTAFLMLLWSPVDLFDLGAQLSFLAVAAIMWCATVLGARRRQLVPDPLAAEPTATSANLEVDVAEDRRRLCGDRGHLAVHPAADARLVPPVLTRRVLHQRHSGAVLGPAAGGRLCDTGRRAGCAVARVDSRAGVRPLPPGPAGDRSLGGRDALRLCLLSGACRLAVGRLLRVACGGDSSSIEHLAATDVEDAGESQWR